MTENIYEEEQWTYTFDKHEMEMLGVAARDSLYTPETFEALVEDMSERTGMSEASAGSVMMAALSYTVHSGDEAFKAFLEDYCKSKLDSNENKGKEVSAYAALGYVWTLACNLTNQGVDIRNYNISHVVADFQADFNIGDKS